MDPQFQELAREIADSVEKRMKEAFGDSEDRIKKHMDAVESGTEARIKKHIDEFETGTEARIKKHIDAFEIRAEQRTKMHFENLEERVKMAADGYGGTLEGIQRQLQRLNDKFDTNFGDHDRVLANHNERIVKLEERRP